MMAAVTVPHAGGDEGRAVVVADGDFITDAWIRNAGNAFVLMDSINWLVGEEQVLGPTQTEEDVPIEHTSEEDKVWFYGTSFAVPLPLLLLGFWLARRRYGRVRDHVPEKGAKRGKPLVPPLGDGDASSSTERASVEDDEDDPPEGAADDDDDETDSDDDTASADDDAGSEDDDSEDDADEGRER